MVTFPPGVTVELFYDNDWQDITNDVRTQEDIVISRGRADESGSLDPGRCSLVLDNTDGRYSPRNPESPLYKKIGRNTPLRVRIGDSDTSIGLSGITGSSWASTPDSAANSITGDIDVRLDVHPSTWRPSASTGYILAAKYRATTNDRSWELFLLADGTLEFSWTTDGLLGTRVARTSTAAIPPDSGRLAIRATLDVDNGSGQHVVNFYTASNLSGPWDALGDAVVTSGTTSIFGGDAPVTVGSVHDGAVNFDGETLQGAIYGFQLYNGIDGTLVLNPDFTSADARDLAFVDSTGAAWTVTGGIVLDTSVRFAGEVSSWPSRWDISGQNVWVPIEAQGITRRLGQGSTPFKSVLRRAIPSLEHLRAYWPCEDGRDSTEIASGLGGPPAKFLFTGPPDFASFDEFAASEPLPTLNGARWDGDVPLYEGTGQVQVRFLLHVPEAGSDDQTPLAHIWTTGTAQLWELVYFSDGGLSMRVYDGSSATPIHDSGGIAFEVNGKLLRVSVSMVNNGPDINYQIQVLEVGNSVGTFIGKTVSGYQIDRARQVIINPHNLGNYHQDVSIGHITVESQETDFFELWEQLTAYDGETALTRIRRLLAEEQIPFVPVGYQGDSERLGTQGRDTVLSLAQECADVDMGILSERRDNIALTYRTRDTLYNQDPLELDYTNIAPPFDPEDDDRYTRNDITVNRVNGSSYRVVDETGPLSVNPAPDGVGRYEESIDLNLYQDGDLKNQATWRLRLGTVDEARFPRVTLNLGNGNMSGLRDSVAAVDVGDRITIANSPSWLPPDTIDLIVQGYEERINAFTWTITYNCSPGTPWRVARVADYDSLNENFEDSTLGVVTSDGGDAPWSRTSSESFNGTWSIRSGVITDGQTSDWIVTVPDNASTVSFWYLLSSELGGDFFRIFFDSTEIGFNSGIFGWQYVSPIDVTGVSTITFRYEKNASVSSGLDAVFVDDLVFTLNTIANASPDDTTRADTGGSELVSGITSTATTMSVATTSGPVWINSADNPHHFPFDVQVGGERMRVTAISGTASPQTFTVTRSVNGVVKSHSAGASVSLAQRAAAAL